ncbi:Pre-mRNA-splicing factor cwf16 [Fusarium irregulare]|uniref:Splicing factor YJU2 n=1 Tax=Fusarium irregulare TaxID=2494466 RepID=A0A9W8UEL1_9HYPO|nr:Pre-mRNA-splicing factor cwf16 [Fusarium irregulare]KAJ4020962.1 Pre-mRNA-splicing factor cwf16 [Fusarium irregulare]
MSERKVLQKYYPPDFDPSALTRRSKTKDAGQVKSIAVRIMTPFSLQCTRCGTFIYKGRKHNARKVTEQGEKYLGIQIVQLHFRCTGCPSVIVLKTDPKNNDYVVYAGAKRNSEPWRNREAENENEEQRLDRLEREEAEAAGEEEKNAMEELEAKNLDAQREMAAADALDEIRHRNARINRSEKEGVDFADTIVRTEDEEREKQEREDGEAAKKAFAAARAQMQMDTIPEEKAPAVLEPVASAPAPSFKRVVKKKKDHSAALGLKKKT